MRKPALIAAAVLPAVTTAAVAGGYQKLKSAKREVRINWGNMTSVLARDEILSVAVCLAALELPNFLERHPECAAVAENDEAEQALCRGRLKEWEFCRRQAG